MPDDAPRAMRTVRYLSGIPRGPLPPGHVVVHNHVQPAHPIGMHGFRAWTAAPADDGGDYRVVPCGCEWAPELGGHYRVHVEREGARS
jgi:hypothetical protein